MVNSREQAEVTEFRLKELELLAESAGAEVVSAYVQKKNRPDKAFCIGKGKLAEIAEDVLSNSIDLIIFDDELTPMQLRNIDNTVEARVIDRTALILDIFAGRARSREGRLQVELAQLKYLLPRLTGYGQALSRLGGGIGTRGPGETRLESDRRRIRKQINNLQNEISAISKHRNLHRRKRKKDGDFMVSLAGYTNAGKSTLLKALTGAEVFTEDKAFATLDPLVRKVKLADGKSFLLTDTVGFIRNLPSQVTDAFMATFEEITEAHLILHVVDLSHQEYLRQIAAVRGTLSRIIRTERKEMIVFNKTDLAAPGAEEKKRLEQEYPGSVFISAKKGEGLEQLKKAIARLMGEDRARATFKIPYSHQHFVQTLYKEGHIIGQKALPEGLIIEAEVSNSFLRRNYSYTGLTEPPAEGNES